MSKAITEIDDPRLVKALAHPLRVRILGILERGITTPKRMADELGVPVENIAYHVRLLRSFGMIKLHSTRQVRGTVEHYYEVIGRTKISNDTWAKLPAIVREAFDAAAISQIVTTLQAASQQGKLDDPSSIMTRLRLRLDDEGFRELGDAVSELILERLPDIERRALARLKRKDHSAEIPAVFIGMLMGAPDMEEAEQSSGKQRAPRRGRIERAHVA